MPLKPHARSQAHAAKSKKDMSAREIYPEPRLEEVTVVAPNKQLLGRTFMRNAKPVQEALERLDGQEALCFKADLDAGRYAVSAAAGKEEGRKGLAHECVCTRACGGLPGMCKGGVA